jgi:hypothetical protein
MNSSIETSNDEMPESDKLILYSETQEITYTSQHLPKKWPRVLVGIQGLSNEQCEELVRIFGDESLKKIATNDFWRSYFQKDPLKTKTRILGDIVKLWKIQKENLDKKAAAVKEPNNQLNCESPAKLLEHTGIIHRLISDKVKQQCSGLGLLILQSLINSMIGLSCAEQQSLIVQ